MKSIFKNRTIITIAHRINTILDSDRIVVLDKGTVAEFDTPAALMQTESLFYKLVKEAGLENAVPGYSGVAKRNANGDGIGENKE